MEQTAFLQPRLHATTFVMEPEQIEIVARIRRKAFRSSNRRAARILLRLAREAEIMPFTDPTAVLLEICEDDALSRLVAHGPLARDVLQRTGMGQVNGVSATTAQTLARHFALSSRRADFPPFD